MKSTAISEPHIQTVCQLHGPSEGSQQQSATLEVFIQLRAGSAQDALLEWSISTGYPYFVMFLVPGICDPPGVLYTEFAYRYYYFEPSNYTWKTAKTFCESSDSQLASFYSEGEFNFVRDTVINGTTGKK